MWWTEERPDSWKCPMTIRPWRCQLVLGFFWANLTSFHNSSSFLLIDNGTTHLAIIQPRVCVLSGYILALSLVASVLSLLHYLLCFNRFWMRLWRSVTTFSQSYLSLSPSSSLLPLDFAASSRTGSRCDPFKSYILGGWSNPNNIYNKSISMVVQLFLCVCKRDRVC